MTDSEHDAVYLKIDKERTSVDAYNQFTEDVLREFPDGQASLSHDQRIELSKTDPNLAAEAAEHAVFLAQDVGIGVLSAYIYNRLTDDGGEEQGGQKVVQTGDGAVYIDSIREMPSDVAKDHVSEKDE